MKRILFAALPLALCLVLLAACAAPAQSTAPPPASSEAPSAVSATSESTPPAESLSEPAEAPSEQLQFHPEVYKENADVVEYLTVSGLADEAVQEKLNEEIKNFYLWQWLARAPSVEPDPYAYIGKAEWHLVGGRYLSLIAQHDVYYDGDPENTSEGNMGRFIMTQVLDVSTGEAASDLVYAGETYTPEMAEKFTQLYPESSDPNAKALLDEFMPQEHFNTFSAAFYYLTESHLVVHLATDGGGSYYLFQAPYGEIGPMLAPELAEALGLAG